MSDFIGKLKNMYDIIEIGDDLKISGSKYYLHVLQKTNRGLFYAIPDIDERVWFSEWSKFTGKWEIEAIAIRDKHE